MLDYWADARTDIPIVSPAIIGCESIHAPFWPAGQCTFLNANSRCELHDLDLKPIEGRLASCAPSSSEAHQCLHEAVARTWATEEGRKVVLEWKERFLRSS